MYSNTKIQASHLERKAIIYVRQSSMYQVINHQESQKRQYGLKERAARLGWDESQILTVDEDLGISGSHSENRPGYQKLISMLALRQVGIILGIEVSRLARNCLDWYQLLELFSAFDTLIADEDAVFNPSDFNDRLLLGLKGTISEVELYQIKARMMRGRMNKARRGDLEITLPIGYERDFLGKICKSPNQEVCFAIERIFELFRKISSVRGILLELKKRQIEMPYWKRAVGLEKTVSWRRPTYEAIYAILNNATYAGFYMYGKRKGEYDPISKKYKHIKIKKELIEVCIPNHHYAYISKEEYELNIKSIKNNQYILQSQGAPREGAALLQGSVFCGKCGLKMRPRYTDKRYYYCCDRDHMKFGDAICGWANAKRIDSAVAEIIFEVLNEGTVDLSFQLSKRYNDQQEAVILQIEQKIKRLEYETNLARRRYELVDPENRLVASTLETEWNEKLSCLNQAKDELNSDYLVKENFANISALETKNILSTLPGSWRSDKISMQDKKEIVRCIIERVFITTEDKVLNVKIAWFGGTITELKIPKYIFSSSHIYYKIIDLACKRTDSEIASILNKENILTVKGRTWNKCRVMDFRLSNGIASGFTNSKEFKVPSGYATSAEVAKELDVAQVTIQRWLKLGILEGRKQLSKQEHLWIYWDDEIKNKLNGTATFDISIKTLRSIMKSTGMKQNEAITWAKEHNHEIIRLSRGNGKYFYIKPNSQ